MSYEFSFESGIFGILLFFMMYGVGTTLDLVQLWSKFIKPKGIFIGIICQYIILPFMCYLFCNLLNFDTIMSIALIIVGTCPGGVNSNYFCLLIGADVELSIAMTSFSSILAFIFIPLNSYIYIQILLDNDEGILLDWIGMLISISFLVSGLIAGVIVSYYKNIKYNNQNKCLNRFQLFSIIFGTLSLITIVVYGLIVSLSDNDNIFENEYIRYWFGTFLLSLSSWIFGLFFSKLFCLKQSSSIAVAIETSNQNTSLSLAILILTFDDLDDSIQSRGYIIPIMYMIHLYWVNLLLMFIFYKLNCVNTQNKHESIHEESTLLTDKQEISMV